MDKARIGIDKRIKFKVAVGVNWLDSWCTLRRAGYAPVSRYRDGTGLWWFVFENREIS